MISLLVLAIAAAAGPPAAGCSALPINGVGAVTTSRGTIAIDAAARGLSLDGRPLRGFGRAASAVTIRAACSAGRVDYVLIASAGPPACPVRYQVVAIGAARTARVSPGFGSCVDGATAVGTVDGLLVTMPAGPASATNVRYRYAAGRITAVAAPPVVVAVAPPAFDARGRALPVLAAMPPTDACSIVARRGEPAQSGDAILGAFERNWPVAWRSRGALRDQPFTAGALRRTVTDLACLSALPGGDKIVSRMARALFESKRHGAGAFEQLDDVARGTAVDPTIRAAARTFHAQMRFEVENPRFR